MTMKVFIAVLISLCLSSSNAQEIINNTAAIGTGPALCNLNVPVLNEFIDKQIAAAIGAGPTLCNLNVPVLNEFIDKRIAAVLADQPIIKMLSLTNTPTSIELHHSNGTLIDSISLSNPAIDVTSTYIAYRPNYADIHNSGLAGMFINMKAIFPCIGTRSPVCRLFTLEEDGFNGGHVFVESADGGNNFQIFSTTTNIPTYGFAIRGCTQMGPNCLSASYFSKTITCLLPRQQCS